MLRMEMAFSVAFKKKKTQEGKKRQDTTRQKGDWEKGSDSLGVSVISEVRFIMRALLVDPLAFAFWQVSFSSHAYFLPFCAWYAQVVSERERERERHRERRGEKS